MICLGLMVCVCCPVWAAAPLSHLGISSSILPPLSLTRPLSNGESPLKGLSPGSERELMTALSGMGLRERILRVAVATPGGTPVALIKVQAGDAQSRAFSLADVEADAMLGLRTCFEMPQQMRHVDFWAVVPERMPDGRDRHRPVFSVSAERKHFLHVMNGNSRPARDLLADLSAVRYDPVFTKHAPDWPQAEPAMPRTAYTFARLADQWRGLISEGASALAGDTDEEDTVHVMLGGVPDGGKVALTIDDGPRPLLTPLFLDVLKRERVQATFFVVGEKAEEYPGLIREIARDGHELGNHTYSHRRFSTLPPEEIYGEIRGCSKIIGRLTGQRPMAMRPPGGDYNADALRITQRLGLITALWTHNTGDWARPEPTAIAYQATHGLHSGDIILMHQGDMRSVQALPMIIERIRARGLRPARLSDVAHNGAIKQLSVAEALAQRTRLNLTE